MAWCCQPGWIARVNRDCSIHWVSILYRLFCCWYIFMDAVINRPGQIIIASGSDVFIRQTGLRAISLRCVFGIACPQQSFLQTSHIRHNNRP